MDSAAPFVILCFSHPVPPFAVFTRLPPPQYPIELLNVSTLPFPFERLFGIRLRSPLPHPAPQCSLLFLFPDHSFLHWRHQEDWAPFFPFLTLPTRLATT